MKEQSFISKKGEIEFRKKLVQQQVERKHIFDDEFDANGIKEILCGRMQKTFEQMTLLKDKRVILSPYVEIGAERCQRSLIMENDIGASGAAVDISYHMLKSCDYYKDLFNKNKAPLRICCDANNLPFMTDSLPFVFCYETLHHFPDPGSIMKGIHRILSPGGYLFFGEESYKRILHINLYKRKKIYSKGPLNAGIIRKIVNYFFSENACNETEYGILEKDDITIGAWKEALRVFEEKNVKLRSMRFINSELFNPSNPICFLLAYLFGGEISGSCRKTGVIAKRQISLCDIIICPSCMEDGQESKLIQNNSLFFCNKCNKKFPVVDGIIFLFSYKKFEELYPEVFKNICC